MMVGRSSSQLFTRLGGKRTSGPIVMTVKNISQDRDPDQPACDPAEGRQHRRAAGEKSSASPG
jgi:hypothetical protein